MKFYKKNISLYVYQKLVLQVLFIKKVRKIKK